MAIYHLSVKIISRGKGQSAVGSAAYRHGRRFYDERIGTAHDYRDKDEVVYSEILIPAKAPAWIQEIVKLQLTEPGKAAEKLWNTVEAFEKRKDSELSREIELALAIELSLEQNIFLVRSFIQEQFCYQGMVADFNIHWVEGNPHVHIMLSTRVLKENGFGPKALQWRNKALLITWRRAWAEYANRALAVEGHDIKIDHRSYVDQGIDLIPTKHEGPARHLHAKGIQTTRMAQNEEIRSQNLEMITEYPELLLKKLGATHNSFETTQVISGVASYVSGKVAPTLVADKAWQGTRQQIESVFRAVAKNEAVFQEKALFTVLSKYTQDAETAAKALVQVKASSELLAIGPGEDGRERYTTRAVFDLENGLQDLADELLSKSSHRVKGHVIQKTLRQFKLKDEQAKAVRHVLFGKDIVAVVGLAGSGKTYSLKAANTAWVASGFKVQGVALSGVAADGLSNAGIKSRTISSFCKALKSGTLVLNKSDVVVMDEAGMTDSLNFFDVLLAVRKAKAKVVLVGDPAQLQPIGFGAPFRALLERIGFVELTIIRRQQENWQREASFKFAKGDIEGAIEAYHAHDCIKLSKRPEEALVSDWYQAIQAKELTLKESLILAYRNVDVALLNNLARQQRIAQGEILEGVMVTTLKGEISISVGDRLIFLENNWGLGVRNGNRGTLIAMRSNRIRVRLDNDKIIEFNPKQYRNFDYGYASTVHKAQGVTVDKTFVLAAGRWVSNLVYVAMTRHRYNATLYANQDTYASIDLLKKAMSRQAVKDSVLDYPLAFAVRRGIDVESIAKRFQNHIRIKIKIIINHIKEQFEKVYNPLSYWKQKKILAEQKYKIQKIISRREDAKLVAAYIDANQEVGKAWKTIKTNPELFQQAQAHRNQIARELMINIARYISAIHYCGISLEKIEKHGATKVTRNEEFSEKQKAMMLYAQKLEQESISIKGTLAEEYLRNHIGITSTIPEGFKFNIAVKEPETQRYLPALIVVAKNSEGKTQAVECIFLDIKTANKAKIKTPKRTYGPMKNTSILVQKGTGQTILTDSLEAALNIANADPTLTVYATFRIYNMEKIPLPDTINKAILYTDDNLFSKSNNVVIKAVEALSQRGIEVELSKPQKIGQDFNDVLIEKNSDEILRQINDIVFHKAAEKFEFEQKLKQYKKIPKEEIILKIKINKELEVMADHIKKDAILSEAAKRYGVYSSVTIYASAHQRTIEYQVKSEKILAELKSEDPIQEYINLTAQQKELPLPWLYATPEQKTEWKALNIRLNTLGFAIDKDTQLSLRAIEKGVYQEIKGKSSTYLAGFRYQQEKDRDTGIER